MKSNLSKNDGYLFIVYSIDEKYWNDNYLILLFNINSERQIESIDKHIELNQYPYRKIHVFYYESFLMGVLKGLPFEISVILNGRVSEHHNCQAVFFDSLKKILPNNNFKKEEIITELEKIIAVYKIDYDEKKTFVLLLIQFFILFQIQYY